MTAPVTDARAARASSPTPGTARRVAGVLPCALILVAVLTASMSIGALEIAPGHLVRFLLHPDPHDQVSLVIWQSRVPRTALILLGGVSFGVAGAVMQAITRNPLTDPGILGVNFGASLAVVIGLAFFGITTIQGYMWWALGGALVTSTVVVILGSTGPMRGSPIKLTLAGVALGAVLSSISHGLLLTDSALYARMRGWAAGSTASQPLENAATVAPLVVLGVVISLVLSRGLNVLGLGDATAIALGARPGRVRAAALVAIALLAGSATAALGPVGFIGLITPHLCRLVVGPHQGWIMGYSILVAPVILGLADILGRIVVQGEVPVGVVTPIIGGPVLILMVRRFQARQL